MGDLSTIQQKARIAALLVGNLESFEVSSVQVLVVDNKRIAELHAQFLNDPSTTDVITFPSEENLGSLQISGDIAIGYEVAVDQAAGGEYSSIDEIVFLIIHGLLHLCGWDDTLPANRASMIARQHEMMAIIDQRTRPQFT